MWLRNLLSEVARRLAALRERPVSVLLSRHKPAVVACLVLILGSAAVVVCCIWEGTIEPLPMDGKGLANHYGILTIFLGSPILVVLAALAQSKFQRTVQNLSVYTVGAQIPPGLTTKIDYSIESLRFQRMTRLVYWLFVTAGWYWWLVNVYQTINPLDFYGNDVFDSLDHLLGFISFKLYLLALWVIIYPVISFIVVNVFVGMIVILKHMSDNSLFKLDFFHEDECGGVSVFGSINTILLAMTSLVLITALAILLTHKSGYTSVWSSVIISSLLIVLQSVCGVYYIHKFVRQKKSEILGPVNAYLNDSLLDTNRTKRFPQDLLIVRDHVARIRSFPYSKGVLYFVNALRLSPAAVGLIHLIQSP